MGLINNFFLESRLICTLAEFDVRLSVSEKALGAPLSFIIITEELPAGKCASPSVKLLLIESQKCVVQVLIGFGALLYKD